MATHHAGISAVQLKRRLGIARYDTAWLILHKLRRAMVAPERQPGPSRSTTPTSAASRRAVVAGESPIR
jgi:hypothetical protein